MQPAPLVCWRCGQALSDEPIPFAREAHCRHCRDEGALPYTMAWL
jgi:hypothetical protein